ncbi:MAG TPA: sialidase family protein, partial [Gaiellaceae bacterium]|nr:sialidase family protein [Gaiellaceae bacterium]
MTAIGAFLVYHFFVRHIHNDRPLAGRNVAIAPGQGTQSEPSFAVDPAGPRIVFGALGASGELVGNPGSFSVFDSADGGTTWRKSGTPAIPGKGCFFAAPRTAIDRSGRQYLAFMAGPCAETLTPYLVFTSRASSTAPWATVTRIAPRVGRWGFDDGPALAVDERSGRLYLAWTRGFDRSRVALVVSSSSDRGSTWTAPHEVWRALVDPHLASIAVGPKGDVYLAGIDGSLGLWVTR